MSRHFPKALLLIVALAGVGETKRPESVLQTNLESSGCEPGDDQYCCWNKKSIGSGDYADKSIKCDQKNQLNHRISYLCEGRGRWGVDSLSDLFKECVVHVRLQLLQGRECVRL